jgi:hypothetical protein
MLGGFRRGGQVPKTMPQPVQQQLPTQRPQPSAVQLGQGRPRGTAGQQARALDQLSYADAYKQFPAQQNQLRDYFAQQAERQLWVTPAWYRRR